MTDRLNGRVLNCPIFVQFESPMKITAPQVRLCLFPIEFLEASLLIVIVPDKTERFGSDGSDFCNPVGYELAWSKECDQVTNINFVSARGTFFRKLTNFVHRRDGDVLCRDSIEGLWRVGDCR